MSNYQEQFKKQELKQSEFSVLSSYIENNLGIRMPPGKKVMLESRLQKRLKALRLSSFQDYIDYLFSSEGHELELPAMIDVVTTNKTDFYRESAHFDYLREHVMPEWLKMQERGPMRLWSAACSTGEEPYTLAFECELFQGANSGFSYSIAASDISGEVLEKARNGIYLQERLGPMPREYTRKFFLRSKDRAKDIVRVRPEIRSHITFIQMNLMKSSFGFKEKFHVVFCRNVMIYFDRERQTKLLRNIARVMDPRGYLFMGHSETLTGLDVPFRSVAATIYKKTEE